MSKQAFGEKVFDDRAAAFAKAARALQAFQLEDYSFHPYSSKYDLALGHKVGGQMTGAELRGFAVFSDPNKGNCYACHYSGPGLNGSVGRAAPGRHSHRAVDAGRAGSQAQTDFPTLAYQRRVFGRKLL